MNIVTIAEIFAALEEHSEGHIFKVSLFSTFVFLLITIPDIDISFYKKLPNNLKRFKYYFSATIYFVLTYIGYKFVFSVFDSVLTTKKEVKKEVKKKEKEEKEVTEE